jgi:hypothetical protein
MSKFLYYIYKYCVHHWHIEPPSSSSHIKMTLITNSMYMTGSTGLNLFMFTYRDVMECFYLFIFWVHMLSK